MSRPGAAAAAASEEEAELMRNFGEHELMGRVQAALKKQLTDNLARAEADLRAQQEAREAAKKAREDVGVELYGIQQQLARVQLDLEARAREAALLQQTRDEQQSALKRFEAGFLMMRAQVEGKEAELEKLKGQLDGINDTMRQVEKYNDEMSAEIALTRRATLKAEEDVVEKEKAKVSQDGFIDGLNTQIARAAEQLALLQAQREAQRRQASSALAAMGEAGAEMDTVQFEKKQLLAQWQSTLVSVKRREEVVAAQLKAIGEAREQYEGMDAEETNLRRATAAAQAQHARLQDMLDRERADLKYIETAVAGLERQFSALEEKQESLGQALSATDAEIKRVTVEQARLLKRGKELDHERGLLDQQRFGVEDEAAKDLAGKMANEKAAKSLLRDVAALHAKMHALEVSRAEAENAIASSRVEALNASARVSALRDAAAVVEKDLGEKERMIARFEGEIKMRHDAIEKKMTQVDRLNRKWEKLAGASPEDAAAAAMGPLQAEATNLQKQAATVRTACEALQRRWLSDQTALVTAANDAEVKATRLREGSSQALLLSQKRARLDAAIAGQKAELRRLEGGAKAMHDDMARINALISRNTALQAKMAGAAELTERAANEELRDAERESANADARIASLSEEKTRLLEDLVEAERQVVLWEKKIALEKETQAALDPSVGAAETAAMEKEIGRMRSRYEALRRDQERLVAEMERAIEKREVIAMKHKSARAVTMAAAAAVGKGTVSGTGASLQGLSSQPRGAEGDSLTRIGLQQRAANLRKDIASKVEQAREMDAAVQASLEEQRAAGEAAAARGQHADHLEARALALQRAANAALFEKQKAVEQAAAYAKLLQRFEALESGRLPGLTAEEQQHARARLADAEQGRDAVRDVVARLAELHGELAEVLGRVAQLVETAPPLVA